MPEQEEPLTPEEVEILKGQLGYGYPEPEEKQNIFNFFKRVIHMSDNRKTGNLTTDELGFVRIPVRTNLELSNYCKVMGMKGFSEVFKEEAQITAGTSLSKEGFLDNLAVTQKREAETRLRKSSSQQINKGWFKPKQQNQEQQF